MVHINKIKLELAENAVLQKFKAQLSRSGCTMREFNLPEPMIVENNATPSVIHVETSYDKEKLLKTASKNVKLMNQEQLDVFNDVIKSVNQGLCKMFCVNAAGGTGKTFILETLLAAVRGDGFVALATASSGVAAQLLSNGTTIHSRFKVPFDIRATST